MDALLKIENLTKVFGGLVALERVCLEIERGKIFGIIGPNGAGKTTLFNIIAGGMKPSGGEVLLEGETISHLKAHEVARKGIIQTFQLTTLFGDLSVLENVLMGFHLKGYGSNWRRWLPRFRYPKGEIQFAENVLETVGLKEFTNRAAGELPHGFQRMLGIGIALAAGPKILLLDEPVAGMTREEKKAMTRLIRDLHCQGITIVLVEHDMRTVMDLCQEILVLNFGRKIAEGRPAEIRSNKDVIEAYLGPEVA